MRISILDHAFTGFLQQIPLVRSSDLHCDQASVATSVDSSARQTGSLSIACATTDMAAAIAAHAAQGACSRISGKRPSTFLRRSIPAAAYRPVQAEVSAAAMATQEEASFTNVHPEAQSWHSLRVKNDNRSDRQREKQRHQHRRNKPLSEVESTDIGHVTAFQIEAGAQTLSVTDSCRGRAVMAKAVTAPSSNSETNRIRGIAISAGNGSEAVKFCEQCEAIRPRRQPLLRKRWPIEAKERTLG
jgi:hypothetical protein